MYFIWYVMLVPITAIYTLVLFPHTQDNTKHFIIQFFPTYIALTVLIYLNHKY